MIDLVTERYWWVKQIHIFRDLSTEDSHALKKITTFENLKHEERITNEGVYLIKQGRIKIADNPNQHDSNNNQHQNEASDSKNNEDSTPSTNVVLETGEMFGVFNLNDEILNGNRDSTSVVETLTEVCIGFVTNRDFRYYLKRKPHLALPLKRRRYFSLNDLLRRDSKPDLTKFKKQSSWKVNPHNLLNRSAFQDCKKFNALHNIVFRSTSSRFALLLLNLASVPDKYGNVYVPRLSKKQISKLVGTSTETIETLLHIFKHNEVIDRRRGRIQILNQWLLKKIGNAQIKKLTQHKENTTSTNFEADFQALTGIQNVDPNDTNSSVTPV